MFIYKFLNSKATNRNTVHSLVKKLKLDKDYKVKLEGNFITLIVKDELPFDLISQKLDYYVLNENKKFSNLIKSEAFVVSKEEVVLDKIKELDSYYLKGNIVFNLAIYENDDEYQLKKFLLEKRKTQSLTKDEEEKLKQLKKCSCFNLIERNALKKEITVAKNKDGKTLFLSHKNYSQEKKEIKEQGFEIVLRKETNTEKQDDENNFLGYVKEQLNRRCDKKYGFKIEFNHSSFSEASSEEKLIRTSHARKTNDKNKGNENLFKLFNLINVDLEVYVTKPELFEKVFYNNVFAKKSYGCGFLDIVKKTSD